MIGKFECARDELCLLPLIGASQVVQDNDDEVSVNFLALCSDCFKQLLSSFQALESIVVILILECLDSSVIQFDQQLLDVLIYIQRCEILVTSQT
jgi:hypothetical protein